MNILKDRAVWIVLVLIFIFGASYMLLIDPDRVDKMENIVLTKLNKLEIGWEKWYNGSIKILQ